MNDPVHGPVNSAAIEEREISVALFVFDPDKAISCMGGKAVYLRVLEKFTTNRGGSVQSIRDAITAADLKRAEYLVHTLKGIAATIGADSLSESARQLEDALHQGVCGQYEQLLESAAAEMANLITLVDAYLKAHETVTEPKAQSADLASLMKQLSGQLEAYAYGSVGTMFKIRQQVKGTAIEKGLVRLNDYIDAYDYENALAEMRRLSGGYYE